MTQEKKKNFGLAAQLAQPRPMVAAEPPPARPPRDAEAQTDAPPVVPAADVDAEDESPLFERSDHTNHTKRRTQKQKKPGAPTREGGYVRRTITLGPALSEYVDRAWRTYRTPTGKYVKGVSGFIEAVIDEHRRRAK
jgi:hypothetical protein